MTEHLPTPTRPTEPEKTEEEYHELNMALASVLTTLKKHKNILIKQAELKQYGQREINITLRFKPTQEAWKAYDLEERDYYNQSRIVRDHNEALDRGITVDQLKEAKKRHELYQAKKCDKAPEHELDYFINIVTGNTNVQINEVSEQSTPELTTA